MSKHGKILVAMSGGIDSTVTAMMLHEQGYEVVGVTMKTWDYKTSGGIPSKETGCCSLDSINDAREIAVDMGFHHFIVDIRDEFGDYVIDNFVDEYISGRTPNPCILCNTHIKWNALLKRADLLDCDYIATGHYANVESNDDRYWISKGKDINKDQSYVLWGLTQECLARTQFPIGNFSKPEIREMALNWGYESLSKKAESYEICFVPGNDYREFLKVQRPELEANVKGGVFVDSENNVIGEHIGYPFFTIGQRKGLGQAFGKPMYVTEIRPESNTVVLGDTSDLLKNTMNVIDVNCMKYNNLGIRDEVVTMVRYNSPGTLSDISSDTSGTAVKVNFHANVKGIAPGQSAVFYEGDDVIGGGIISTNFN